MRFNPPTPEGFLSQLPNEKFRTWDFFFPFFLASERILFQMDLAGGKEKGVCQPVGARRRELSLEEACMLH